MASQEHVQQFLDDDSSSTSTSDSSSDNDSSTSDEPQQQQQPPPSLSSVPPKMRIKLSLKLSKSGEEKNKEGKTDDTAMEIDETDASTTPTAMVVDEVEKSDKKQQEQAGDDDEVVKATVVHSSDDAHDDVEAQPVVSTTAGPIVAKKKTARPVRMPPMSSPGLLIPPSAGVYRGDADLNGFTTPASIFDHCMSSGGYTVEARTNHPHRGSSVKREVGDMFDSNVTLALHFPPLVPKEVWNLKRRKGTRS